MSEYASMNQLLNEVQTISKTYNRIAEATGENFNIFSTLEVESDEVRTHSRFLAELLDPKGSHGQKDEFIKLFKDQFCNIEFDSKSAVVQTEYPIKQGRIDVFLKDGKNNIIIIENKIFAIEQEDQLMKYSQAFPDKKNRELFFLTLKGNESQFASTDVYNSISYESDIIKWLEACKQKAVDIPILRETIAQYINLIKKLTNQNVNYTMSKEIVSRVLRDEESFDAYKKMIRSKKEVFKTIINTKIIPTFETIANDYELNLTMDNNKKGRIFQFESDELNKNNVKIAFYFKKEKHKDFTFGFWLIDSEHYSNKQEEIRNKFENQFDKVSGKNRTLCCTPCLKYPDWGKVDTLEKIYFGDFKQDIQDKVEKMLAMID